MLRLFKRTPSTIKIIERLQRLDEEPPAFQRIRCPVCAWQPAPSSRWSCFGDGPPEFLQGGCGTVWNTFETHGRCPGCQHQWRWTACLRCDQWSLHEDWYATEEDRHSH